MPDKKFIRDLNSLIRTPTRKRLKAAGGRVALPGGSGIAEIGDDEPDDVIQYMYIRHNGGGILNDVYRYDPDGGAPTFVINSNAGAGLGVVDGDVFAAVSTNGSIYKNGVSIAGNSYGNGQLAASSFDLIVEEANGGYFLHKFDHSGTFIATQTPPQMWESSVVLAANNEVIAFKDEGPFVQGQGSPARMRIVDRSNTLLGSIDFWNITYADIAACSKHCTLFVNYNGGPEFHIMNNDGTVIGVHATSGLEAACGGTLQTVGITENRIYCFGASATQPYCVIYELTLTLDGTGLATASTLGAVLHSVATPQTNNLANQGGEWQTAAMDASLFA